MTAVTLTHVASHAGVSLTTASRVLNGSSRRPAAAIALRVQHSAKILGYVANAQAQSLVRSATQLLGVITNNLTEPGTAAILGELSAAAQQSHRDILLLSNAASVDGQLQAVRSCRSRHTDAIIVLYPSRWKLDDLTSNELQHYAETTGAVIIIDLPHQASTSAQAQGWEHRLSAPASGLSPMVYREVGRRAVRLALEDRAIAASMT